MNRTRHQSEVLQMARLRKAWQQRYRPQKAFIKVTPQLQEALEEAVRLSGMDQATWAFCGGFSGSTVSKIRLGIFKTINVDLHARIRALIKATKAEHRRVGGGH